MSQSRDREGWQHRIAVGLRVSDCYFEKNICSFGLSSVVSNVTRSSTVQDVILVHTETLFERWPSFDRLPGLLEKPGGALGETFVSYFSFEFVKWKRRKFSFMFYFVLLSSSRLIHSVW